MRIPRDGCQVTAEPFAELVRDFVTTWNRTRPQPGGQYGLEEEPPVRALAWLSAEASRPGNSAAESGSAAICDLVTEGTLEGLLDRGTRAKATIELRIADAIAVALDRPDIFYDPRVLVSANPHATMSAQRECCAGSESVSAA